MASLYPPYLEGTLPAFCLTDTVDATEYDSAALYSIDDVVFMYLDAIQTEDGNWQYISEDYVGDQTSEKKLFYFISTMGKNKNNSPIDSDCWKDYQEGDGEIIIPFEHNKAVATRDVSDISIKVKTIQNDALIDGSILGEYDAESKTVKLLVKKYYVQSRTVDSEGNVTYSNSGWKVRIGQFYKVQIAYINSVTTGYYSTVGVIKCTSKPRVTIDGLTRDDEVNSPGNIFIGSFKQPFGGDLTEKVYSSSFVVHDPDGNVLVESGELLHNVENNPDSYSSYDLFHFNRELPLGSLHTIQYTVVTNNNLTVSSPKYYLAQQLALFSDFNGALIAKFHPDDGVAEIFLKGSIDEDGVPEAVNGIFALTREDSLYPGVWDELYRFSLNFEIPTKVLFRDFTVEHGKHYRYAIQQINKNRLFSDRIISNTIVADFDDIFIYDGERQLKLRFNPQVSNYKTQLAESKTDTIGNKYPFFFRNAKVGYKTFPVSGLISMFMDENQFFVKYKDILREKDKLHNHRTNPNFSEEYPERDDWLIGKNFVSERIFKNQVLDWFNDGKTKLFRSPAEGNFLVRFMDTSLSPNTTLGRMIHTLNSTAYECAACTNENYLKYNIYTTNEFGDDDFDFRVEAWREVGMFKDGKFNIEFFTGTNDNKKIKYSENLLKSDIQQSYTNNVRFTDFLPGTMVRLVFDVSGDFNSPNSEDIVIGATGEYKVDEIKPIYGIYLWYDEKWDGILNSSGKVLYQYRTSNRDEFDIIKSVTTNTSEYLQFVGETSFSDDPDKSVYSNIRETMSYIAVAKFHKRPLHFLYYKGNFSCADGDPFDENIHNLYWDYSFSKNEKFTLEAGMAYSPFGLYILQNDVLDGVHIGEHSYETLGTNIKDGEATLAAIRPNHIFEKYYIDRIMAGNPSPEDLIKQKEEDIAMPSNTGMPPLYILDLWNKTLHVLDKTSSYSYRPSLFIKNGEDTDGEPIDLREIEEYEIEDYKLIGNYIKTYNGIYGEVFYQQLIKNFGDIENSLPEAVITNQEGEEIPLGHSWKDEWLALKEDAEGSETISQSTLESVQYAHDRYLQDLTNLIYNWKERV